MPAKGAKSQPLTNINTNNNTNNVNVNVKVEQPKKRSYNRKQKSNWVKKAFIGGLITLAFSMLAFFVKQNLEDKPERNSTSITPDGQPLQGQKQTKN
jgi:hypothetical protein